jgi:hypothetical protein
MEFPQNRAELYKEAVDALLKRWDASRRIKREEIYKHLSLKRKESLFSRIAAETFEKGMYFFPQHTLERSISQFVEHLPEARGTDIDVDCEAVLRAIEAQHGIFVQRAKGIYSYSHLTFQEYFTAKYIVDNAKKGTLENLVENHLFDKRWREVFLLTSGMLDEADEFLMLIKSKVETLKEYPTVVKLLDMVQRSIKDNTLYSSAFCRTLAFVDRINQARIHVQVKNQEIENENQRDYELEFDLDNALDEAIEFSIEIALADASASCLASALEHAQEGVRKRARAIEIEFFPDSEREASSTPKLRDDFTATQLEKMRLEHQKTKVDSERSLENALERVLDRSRTLAIRRARERLRRLTLGNWSASPNDTDRSLEGALERSLNRARYLTLEIDRDLEKGVGLHEVSEYLKVNKLLVDCLNAEAYISRSTRKKILDELLTFS